MTKTINKAKKLLSKGNYLVLFTIILLLNSNIAHAAGTPPATYGGLDTLFAMFAGILQKVSGGIGLLGAVFFGMAIYQDNPDGKVRGVKMMAAGMFLFAVATGYKTFLT